MTKIYNSSAWTGRRRRLPYSKDITLWYKLQKFCFSNFHFEKKFPFIFIHRRLKRIINIASSIIGFLGLMYSFFIEQSLLYFIICSVCYLIPEGLQRINVYKYRFRNVGPVYNDTLYNEIESIFGIFFSDDYYNPFIKIVNSPGQSIELIFQAAIDNSEQRRSIQDFIDQCSTPQIKLIYTKDKTISIMIVYDDLKKYPKIPKSKITAKGFLTNTRVHHLNFGGMDENEIDYLNVILKLKNKISRVCIIANKKKYCDFEVLCTDEIEKDTIEYHHIHSLGLHREIFYPVEDYFSIM